MGMNKDIIKPLRLRDLEIDKVLEKERRDFEERPQVYRQTFGMEIFINSTLHINLLDNSPH